MPKSQSQTEPRKKTPQELEEEKKKYEEFWSDPCWTEPLDEKRSLNAALN